MPEFEQMRNNGNNVQNRRDSIGSVVSEVTPTPSPSPSPRLVPQPVPSLPPGPGLQSYFIELRPTNATRKRPLRNLSPSSVTDVITSEILKRFIDQAAFGNLDETKKKEIISAIKTLIKYLTQLEESKITPELTQETKNAVKQFMTTEIFKYIRDNYDIDKSSFKTHVPHMLWNTPMHTEWNETDIDTPKDEKYLLLMVYLTLLYIYQSTPAGLSGGSKRRTRKNKKSKRNTSRR
jgi:hypothetical protein